MFRTKNLAEVRGEKKYGGKEVKQVAALLEAKFNDTVSAGKKSGLSLKQGAQTVGFLANGEDELLYVAPDSRGFEKSGKLFPTLLTLWRVPEVRAALPRVLINWQTSKFVVNGADLMAAGVRELRCVEPTGTPTVPGLEKPGHPLCIFPGEYPMERLVDAVYSPEQAKACVELSDFGGSISSDSWKNAIEGRGTIGLLVCVYVTGNDLPLAVGEWQGAGPIAAKKGVAVKVLHRYGDFLWQRSPQIPDGFESDRVMPLMAPPAGAKADAAVDADDDGGEEEGEDEEAEDSDGDAAVAVTSRDAPDELVRKMDELMRTCVLQLAATSAIPNSKLPMDLNIFYAQYLRPARPKGTSVDVKKSSFKKLKGFCEALAEENLLSLNKGATQITRVNRGHDDVKAHAVYESEEAVNGGASAAGSGGGASGTLSTNQLAELKTGGMAQVTVTACLRLDPAALGFLCKDLTDGLRDEKEFCLEVFEKPSPLLHLETGRGGSGGHVVYVDDKDMLSRLLRRYATRNNLFASKKLVKTSGCDASAPLGAALERCGVSGGASMPLDSIVHRLLGGAEQSQAAAAAGPKLVKRCHRIHSMTLMRVETVKFREKDPPCIQIRTEKRMNHNYTIIQGLDQAAYAFDLDKVGAFLKQKFGVASMVEEIGSGGGGSAPGGDKPKMILLLQGFWDKTLAEEVLPKLLGVPSAAIENTAEGRKKDMKEKVQKKATNVVR